MPRIKQKNKMKYQCNQCDFNWEGTSYTFDIVREHEKTHPEIYISKISRKNMSNRCKVCNTPKVTTNQINYDGKWECKTCGNLLDAQGRVISS